MTSATTRSPGRTLLALMSALALALTLSPTSPVGAAGGTPITTDPLPSEYPVCDADGIVPISQVQGPGDASPIVGEVVTVEAVVTLVAPGLQGLFVQEEPDDHDGRADTSEGVFVFTGDNFLEGPVDETDTVQITGPVSEFSGKTQLSSVDDVAVCDVAPVEIEPVALPLPSSPAERERFEGMLVTASELVVSGTFSAYEDGELITGHRGVLPSATEVAAPGPEAEQAAADAEAREVILDDRRTERLFARSIWDEDPERRLGDRIPEVTGVLDFSFGDYKIQYTSFPTFELFGAPEVPDLAEGNDIAAFNVLNLFQDLDGRGARDAEQFDLQSSKIVDTILGLDAAVLGLVELQNDYLLDYDGDDRTQPSVGVLVDLINEAAGEDLYDYVRMPQEQLLVDDAASYGGGVGSDEIANGIIYQPERASPVGEAATFYIDEGLGQYPLDDDNVLVDEDPGPATKTRWPFAASFEIDGQLATVAVNHFKSKGSTCEGVYDTADEPAFELFDDDGSTRAGNCDLTRRYTANALVDWIAGDPTDAGTDNVFLVGDFNSYAEEAPIAILQDAGYLDMVEDLADGAFTYKFSGRVGTLDYIMASGPAAAIVDDAAVWQTNSRASYVDLYYIADDTTVASGNLPKGASDHDPLVVSLPAAVDGPGPR